MNCKLTLTASVMFLVTAAVAQTTPSQQPARRAATVSIAQILDQRIPEVRFQEVPLEQVVQWVIDLTQLNISVRWNVLQDAGVNRDTPISVQARNLRLAQVLSLIMSAAGGTDTRLAYRASGNLLLLSTADDLNRELVTKVYDVADLLVRIPYASRHSGMDVTQNLGRSTGGGSGLMSASNTGSDEDPTTAGRGEAEEIKSLIELIEQTIEPDTWRTNGGPGTIAAFRRSLVVRNTLAVHQLLGGYLTEDETAGH